MKDTARRPFIIVLIAAAILSATTIFLRTFLLLTAYRADIGHFNETPLATVVFPLLFVLALVLFFSFGFIEKDSLGDNGLYASLPTVFASAFTAIAFAVWMITTLPLVFSQRGTTALFGILMFLFAFGLIAYFVCTALSAVDKSIRAALCLCAALFCILYVLFSYFDTSFVLNSPIKVFDQITMIVFSVFFLAECRLHFGGIRYFVYLPIVLFAAMIGSTNALSALIYAAVAREPLMGGVMHDFIILALVLYTVARLAALLPREAVKERESIYKEALAPHAPVDKTATEDTLPLGDPDQEAFDFDATDADKADGDADEATED